MTLIAIIHLLLFSGNTHKISRGNSLHVLGTTYKFLKWLNKNWHTIYNSTAYYYKMEAESSKPRRRTSVENFESDAKSSPRRRTSV